jgi:hypothetical protein
MGFPLPGARESELRVESVSRRSSFSRVPRLAVPIARLEPAFPLRTELRTLALPKAPEIARFASPKTSIPGCEGDLQSGSAPDELGRVRTIDLRSLIGPASLRGHEEQTRPRGARIGGESLVARSSPHGLRKNRTQGEEIGMDDARIRVAPTKYLSTRKKGEKTIGQAVRQPAGSSDSCRIRTSMF